MTSSSFASKSIAVQLNLKRTERGDWILATCKILANGKQVTFLPSFYGKSTLISLDS